MSTVHTSTGSCRQCNNLLYDIKRRYCSKECAFGDFGERGIKGKTKRLPSICEISGCERLSMARGLCKPHYGVAWRTGTLPVRRCQCGREVPKGRGIPSCSTCIDAAKQRARLKLMYGIGDVEYNELASMQSNMCAICGRSQSGDLGDRLVVDHDHGDDTVRGLLCSNCNRGLGLFSDDPVALRAAADYLIKRGWYGR